MSKTNPPRATKKRTPGPRASTTKNNAPAVREIDQSTWRTKLQARRVKLDDKAKQVYLATLSETGMKLKSAETAGVTAMTVENHRSNDPDFNEACDEALKRWYENKVLSVHIRLITEGEPVPHIGRVGKDEDAVIHTSYRVPTNMLLKELQKHDPAYRNKIEVDNTNTAPPVVVIPAAMTMREWIEKFGSDKSQATDADFTEAPPQLPAPDPEKR